jgi:hypothetical protein
MLVSLLAGCRPSLNEQEDAACANIASREINEFSAKKAYQDCAKTIKEKLAKQASQQAEYEAKYNGAWNRVLQRCRQLQPEWKRARETQKLYLDKHGLTEQEWWENNAETLSPPPTELEIRAQHSDFSEGSEFRKARDRQFSIQREIVSLESSVLHDDFYRLEMSEGGPISPSGGKVAELMNTCQMPIIPLAQ